MASIEVENMHILQIRNPASGIYPTEIRAPVHMDACTWGVYIGEQTAEPTPEYCAALRMSVLEFLMEMHEVCSKKKIKMQKGVDHFFYLLEVLLYVCMCIN